MNNYQVTTTQGVIKFQACDSDFAVWKANEINAIGLGNTERVDLILISHDEIKAKDFELNCGQFNLVGVGADAVEELDASSLADLKDEADTFEQVCWSRMDENSGLPLPYTKEHLMESLHSTHTLCGLLIPNKNDVMDIASEQSTDICKRCKKASGKLTRKLNS
ncbi:hypothetical protein KO527_05300 [Pseudoalteromonas sp. C2R02]|uniref:hypothetical protein n=1 Tax=Pseudoalteromonas sp. C2R02 TaxID=2841565 RepID=UPI001C0A0C3B|nr:hypothetical protein [Pseudoalteromonas sp. C2R02]MBU2968764.1 hypothetical protein [Pseudoalteromonas sp. C2R02]